MFRAREIGVKTGSGEFRAKGNTEYLYSSNMNCRIGKVGS
jgi:hypothetical protein